MSRKKHPSKEIEDAVAYAETKGWEYISAGKSAHAWGKMHCPYNSKDCRCGEHCITSIWSTPRNEKDHARKIIKVVDKCTKLGKEET